MNIAQRGLIFTIRIYQLTLSPLLATALGASGRCRFTPSCSQYAREAIGLHGAIQGGWLAVRRICRCHPWGECGEDLPPPAGRVRLRRTLNRFSHGSKSARPREAQHNCEESRPTVSKRRHCHGS